MTDSGALIGLELEHVTIARGDAILLDDIVLSVKCGEALQLFGANGCGKSSLLSVIAGHSAPSSGKIFWRFDGETASVKETVDQQVFVGHETPLRPSLTAYENLQYWAGVYGKKTGVIEPALERCGMVDFRDAPCERLSEGQKRRLELARCLMSQRPIWILDEPTASLDRSGNRIWSEEIREHQSNGGIAIIATHDRLDIRSRDIQVG